MLYVSHFINLQCFTSTRFYICNALRDNDYPGCLLNKIKKEIKHKKANKNDHIRKKKRNYVGFTNEVSKILQKFNIVVYLSLINN